MGTRDDNELLAKARLLHQSVQHLRAFVLKGKAPDRIWRGMPKEPTMPQVRALFALHLLGPCRLKEFADQLAISGAAASEMINRMVELGFVTRSQDPRDRRQVIISLTPEAKKRTESHERHILERIIEVMKRLEPAQVEAWVGIFEVISQAIESGEQEHGRKDRTA